MICPNCKKESGFDCFVNVGIIQDDCKNCGVRLRIKPDIAVSKKILIWQVKLLVPILGVLLLGTSFLANHLEPTWWFESSWFWIWLMFCVIVFICFGSKSATLREKLHELELIDETNKYPLRCGVIAEVLKLVGEWMDKHTK